MRGQRFDGGPRRDSIEERIVTHLVLVLQHGDEALAESLTCSDAEPLSRFADLDGVGAPYGDSGWLQRIICRLSKDLRVAVP